MKSLKERLEEKIEKESAQHANTEGDNGNAQISYKAGAASLVPLVVELANKLERIEKGEYVVDDLHFKFSTHSMQQMAHEALQSIEKFLGGNK